MGIRPKDSWATGCDRSRARASRGSRARPRRRRGPAGRGAAGVAGAARQRARRRRRAGRRSRTSAGAPTVAPDPRGDCTVALVICTFGDALLDVIVRIADPLAPGADTPVETRVATGGQAANVAAWAAELGDGARCVAKQGDDAAGALVRTLLERRSVELVGPVVAGSTGTVVALVAPDGERAMATDRGVSVELRAGELEPGWFDCAWLHLSGYALLAEPIAEAALAAVRLARAREARVAVDLSSWSAIREYGQ